MTADAILQHQQIKRRIAQRIGHEWKPGDRLPPINQLARDMGVGENSAYRAVRELRDEGVLASRPRIGTVVTDRPRGGAIKPAVSKSIYLRLAAQRDGMLHAMAHAFATEMQRRGRVVTFGGEPDLGTGKIDLTGLEHDAVVLLNLTDTHVEWGDGESPIISLLDTSGSTPRNLHSRYDLVGPDNEQGGVLAGEALRRFGISDPAFVGVPEKNSNDYRALDATRLAGFERGFGRTLKPDRLFRVESYGQAHGAQFAADFAKMKMRPEALFTSSDDIAAGFALGATTLGLEARRDYLLVGFDGQSAASAAAYGGITTVAVPVEAMGRQAAEFLDMRLDHPDLPPRSISLGCTLRRGKTTPRPTDARHPFWDADIWPPVQKEKNAL